MAGIIALILGLILTRYYKEIADNFGSGISSYSRYKLVGVIITVSGLVMIFNLHTIVLNLLAYLITGGREAPGN